ncbi:MAG: DUF4912 domain-containing protein [Spirochaetaceae bacterium]|nr:DUF4912 domain-containing protein [Spirochaetaceae bacterium]
MRSAVEITALRERLAALSDGSLRDLARKEGLEAPQDVARILLIDLLLEVLEEEYKEENSQNNDSVRIQQIKYDLPYSEKNRKENGEAAFPERYNDTRLVLLLRDPFWAFAYWDIRGGTLKSVKKENEAETVVLRVLRLKGSPPEPGSIVDSFDIPLGLADSSRYINIPRQDALYRAVLVLQGKTWEKQLVASNTVQVPAALCTDESLASDIVVLSEIGKLDIAQPGESNVPDPQQAIPQRISSQETAQFLERGK